MPQLTTSKACAHCASRTLAIRQGTNHTLHVILTLLTMGFWIPVWILCGLVSVSGHWQCSKCGLKV